MNGRKFTYSCQMVCVLAFDGISSLMLRFTWLYHLLNWEYFIVGRRCWTENRKKNMSPVMSKEWRIGFQIILNWCRINFQDLWRNFDWWNYFLSDKSKNTLHKKRSFPLRISSVNLTKSPVSREFGHMYWRNS